MRPPARDADVVAVPRREPVELVPPDRVLVDLVLVDLVLVVLVDTDDALVLLGRPDDGVPPVRRRAGCVVVVDVRPDVPAVERRGALSAEGGRVTPATLARRTGPAGEDAPRRDESAGPVARSAPSPP